jgi:non-ribosomal peptide synthetase component F
MKSTYKVRCIQKIPQNKNLAYVIQTSGTTDIPKVIQVFNSSITSNIQELWYNQNLFYITLL